MGRDKIAEARLDGMDYALRQVKKIGAEEFEKELKWRNRNGISLPVSQRELNENSNQIRTNILKFVLTVAIAILHDEYDFKTEECNRFRDRFNLKVSCMDEGLASLDDYTDMIKEELDIEVGV